MRCGGPLPACSVREGRERSCVSVVVGVGGLCLCLFVCVSVCVYLSTDSDKQTHPPTHPSPLHPHNQPLTLTPPLPPHQTPQRTPSCRSSSTPPPTPHPHTTAGPLTTTDHLPPTSTPTADPLMSLVIVGIIVATTLPVLRQSARILLNFTPKGEPRGEERAWVPLCRPPFLLSHHTQSHQG